jgi:hypothetical protein
MKRQKQIEEETNERKMGEQKGKSGRKRKKETEKETQTKNKTAQAKATKEGMKKAKHT